MIKKVKIAVVLLLVVVMFGGCQKNVKLDNGDVYEGSLKYIFTGPMDGNGKYTYSNGDIYEGEFKDNEMMGDGVLTIDNGSQIFDGNFGEKEFKGTYTAKKDGTNLAKGDLTCTRESLFETKVVSGTFDGLAYDENGEVIIDGVVKGDIPSSGDIGDGNEFSLSGKLYDGGELVFEGDKLKFNKDGSIDIDGSFYTSGVLYLEGEFKMASDGSVSGNGKYYDYTTGELIQEGDIEF